LSCTDEAKARGSALIALLPSLDGNSKWGKDDLARKRKMQKEGRTVAWPVKSCATIRSTLAAIERHRSNHKKLASQAGALVSYVSAAVLSDG
jgi:hypothetical protein